MSANCLIAIGVFIILCSAAAIWCACAGASLGDRKMELIDWKEKAHEA